jgi:hypothetical protein
MERESVGRRVRLATLSAIEEMPYGFVRIL